MDLSHPLRSLIPSLDGAVLEVLAGSIVWFNAGLIPRLAGNGSVAGVRLVLARLTAEGLVLHDQRGRNHYYLANRDHVLWPAIETALGARQDLESRIQSEIEGWATSPLSVALFGSTARGESTSESDLDLLVVWSTKSESLDSDEQALATHIESWTGNRAQIFSLDRDGLRDQLHTDEPILGEWVRDARTIFGSDIRDLIRSA